jgi:hypoxanthine phosphoribosyltransferase
MKETEMTQVRIPGIPISIKLRILLLLYRAKYLIRPLLRIFGLKLNMTWTEVGLAVQLIAPEVSRYNPEAVFGVGVGGTLYGAMLAGNLGGPPFIGLDRQVNWHGKREVSLVASGSICGHKDLIQGKRVLLVSAEIRSGQTTDVLKREIQSLGPSEIRIACIDYSPEATVTPDYWYLCERRVLQKPWRLLTTSRCEDDGPRPD